jgi:transposase
MDNASIHWNLGIEDWLSQYGVSIEYLPPYSSDFNPIETTFSTLKA